MLIAPASLVGAKAQLCCAVDVISILRCVNADNQNKKRGHFVADATKWLKNKILVILVEFVLICIAKHIKKTFQNNINQMARDASFLELFHCNSSILHVF